MKTNTQLQTDINKLYTACLDTENSEAFESNFNKLSNYCKKHKANLIDNIKNRSLKKAMYNTICFAEKNRSAEKYEVALSVTENEVAEKYEAVQQKMSKQNRRHVTLCCLATQKMSVNDILKCFNLYAEAKYFNATVANLKCLSSVLSQENNKAYSYCFDYTDCFKNKDKAIIVKDKATNKEVTDYSIIHI